LDAEKIAQAAGISTSQVFAHESGDTIDIGRFTVEVLHTPGHTPGSCCFKVEKALFSGDTLFVQGCGRTDLEGGDSDKMFNTLMACISKLPGDLMVYPGHPYGGEKAILSQMRESNQLLQIKDLNTWRRLQGP